MLSFKRGSSEEDMRKAREVKNPEKLREQWMKEMTPTSISKLSTKEFQEKYAVLELLPSTNNNHIRLFNMFEFERYCRNPGYSPRYLKLGDEPQQVPILAVTPQTSELNKPATPVVKLSRSKLVPIAHDAKKAVEAGKMKPEERRFLELRMQYRNTNVFQMEADGSTTLWTIADISADPQDTTTTLVRFVDGKKVTRKEKLEQVILQDETAKHIEANRPAQDAQARFARRMEKGGYILLPSKDGKSMEMWYIVNVVRGDDKAPVVLTDGRKHYRTVAALDLERFEDGMKALAGVDDAAKVERIEVPPVLPPVLPAIVTEEEDEKGADGKVLFRRRVGGVDASQAVKARSRDTAEAELHREEKESSLIGRIFKHNILYELYRQWGVNRNRNRILSEQNLYAADGKTKAEYEVAKGAIIDRFIAENEDLLHKEGKEGEARHVFGKTPAELEVKKELNNLVRLFASGIPGDPGAMTEKEFMTQKNRIFAEANKLSGDAKGEGLMYVDNLEGIAEDLRKAAAVAGGMQNLDIDLDLVIGRAKLGARTEKDRNRVDQALDKLSTYGAAGGVTTGILRVFHSALGVAAVTSAVGLTAGALYSGGMLGANLKLGAMRVATFGLSGVLSGAFAWFKEKDKQGQERSLHERQRAEGMVLRTEEEKAATNARERELRRQLAVLGPLDLVKKMSLRKQIALNEKQNQPRREQMELFAAPRLEAKAMIDILNTYIRNGGYDLQKNIAFFGAKDPSFGIITASHGMTEIAKMLARIDAAVRLSDRDGVDLIQYTNVLSVEKERNDLEIARMTLKTLLRREYDADTTVMDKSKYPTFDAFYASIYSLEDLEGKKGAPTPLEQKYQTQEKKFNEYANRRATSVMKWTIALGSLFGFAAQEAGAMGVTDHVTGLWDEMIGRHVPGNATTLLARPIEWIKDYLHQGAHGSLLPVGPTHSEIIGGVTFNLPQGLSILHMPNGTDALVRLSDHSVIVPDLHIHAGVLDPSTINHLHNAGINMNQSHYFTNSTNVVPKSTTWSDFWKEHNPLLQKKFNPYMDLDTPLPIVERFNEGSLESIKTHGVNSWLDPAGNGSWKMSHMTSTGSFHDAMHPDVVQAMHAGKMELWITPDSHFPDHKLLYMFDTHGNAIVPAGSTDMSTLYQSVKGALQFVGDRAEVVVRDAAGHPMICATYKGLDSAIPMTHENVGEAVRHTITNLVGSPAVEHITPHTIFPPFIPITDRKPLEREGGSERDDIEKGNYGYYTNHGNYSESKELKDFKKHWTDMRTLRLVSSEKLTGQLVDQCRALNLRLKGKYDGVFARLEELSHYDTLSEQAKDVYREELRISNLRYFGDDQKEYSSIEKYIHDQIDRIHKQMENILLEEAPMGSRPFPKEFYREAPMVRGIDRAEEIVLIFEPSIGDSVLTVPAIHALNAYLKNQKSDKKIIVVTKNTKLLKGLEDQFPGRVELIAQKDIAKRFVEKKERYVINVQVHFENYAAFGLSEEESKDPSHVLSVDWSKWTKEEYPIQKGKIKTYDPIPARIMRDFELMLGERLFDDIHQVDHFIERSKDFTVQSAELRRKYNIRPGEKVIAITYGAGVTPKEYHPDQWKALLELIFTKYKGAHVLWLESPDPEKRAEYAGAINELILRKGYKISRVTEGMEYMNTVMSMSNLSVTPDTGLGHFSGAVGTPNVMMTLVNPVQWSTAKTVRVMHPKAYETYKKGLGSYNLMWAKPEGYYVDDHGKKVGASNIPPEQVFEKVEEILG